MIIDCIADLHGHFPTLEGGDLLIVAGDLTAHDTLEEHSDVLNWIHKQHYRKKVLVAGNHDNFLQKHPNFYSRTTINYLCDSGTEFTYYDPLEKDGPSDVKRTTYKIWGSPWTAQFPGINPKCCAFTENVGCDTDFWLEEHWQKIPDDIDILVTHGPPYGILDQTKDGILAGSPFLLYRCTEIKPLIHCFGHIHENGGKETLISWKNGTRFINCSHVNEKYEPVNKPVRVIL